MDLSGAQKIAIVGGGQAGAQAVISLRQWGYQGELTLVGDEPDLPYQRPPLSKAYLKGELARERLYFKPDDWYRTNGIDLHLETSATAIDRSARRLRLANGGELAYDALILATGSRPRSLPVDGANLDGVHVLRGLQDVDRLASELEPNRRIVIVGAGYIGLEAAAVAQGMGLSVTVLEMAPRVLARVTSPIMSDFYASAHKKRGVEIHTGAQLSHLKGTHGHVTSAELADGRALACDLVLAGIGILPNDELAKSAGLTCRNGILVDRDARTSDPRIFAAGDCTVRPLVHYGRAGRLESVHNAIEQGKLVAAAIMGRARPAEDAPWFWSDQYDLKLQIAGLSEGYDKYVVRGDPNTEKFAVFYLHQRRLIAVDAVNSPPEFLASKKMIIAGVQVAPDDLQDTSLSMKDIATRVAA